MGIVGRKNFGIIYYLVAILLLSGQASLLGLFGAFTKLRDKRVFLILAYLFFFLIEVSLVAKQGYRYLTPFFPMLAIAGGVGLAQAMKKRWWQTFLITSLITWQILLLLQKFPYTGTFFNPLFGGHKTASHVFPLMEQGEGIDKAASFLDTKVETPYTIACTTPLMCQQHFKGKTLPASKAEEADYLLFDRNKIVRQLAGNLWENYQNKKPLYIVSFDNIPYLYLYKRETN